MSLTLEASTAEVVCERVTHVVATFLQLDPVEIDPRTPLVLYGLDSMRSIELVALLEECFRRTFPEWLLIDHPDIDALARAICEAKPAEHDWLGLMMADSVLPGEISPPAARGDADYGRHVLLTGATGFLGAYLLRTLLTETHADVYCLVRANGSQAHADALTRILRNLARYDLCDDAFTDRIRAVPGDLTAAGFGLAGDAYQVLSEKIDTIYHAAADVNWVVPYAALRTTNVIGTRELLRLACHRRPKRFHFISSLSVCYAVGGPASVSEDADLLPIVDRLPLGYAQSKCVAEALVRHAMARGLSASIHRPALIAGDSITGASNVDDLVATLFKGCIQMGIAPDLDWMLDVIPVDQAARAIVHLPRPATEGLGSFHLSNAHPRHWRECVLLMNLLGYPVSLVPYEKWAKQLSRDAESPDHALHRLRNFFLRRTAGGTTVPELYQEGRSSTPVCVRSQAIGMAAGLNCRRLDAELLGRYFDDYIARGFLPEPGRTSWSPRPGLPTPPCHEEPGFLERVLRRHFGDESLNVRDLVLRASGSQHSIIGELCSWRHRRRTGLFEYRLTLEQRDTARTIDLVVKAKPSDEEVMEVAETVASVCDARLAWVLTEHRERIGIRGAHLRELAMYEEPDDRFRRHMPVCFGTWQDAGRGEWGLALERLNGLTLMDASDDPTGWSTEHVQAVIAGLAQLHAVWYGREAELSSQPWLGHAASLESVVEMTPLWRALADHAQPYLLNWTDQALVESHRKLVESITDWWQPLESSPRTLIHNDFSPRNVALREDGGALRLCAYDWELATLGAPQSDLAHFLCFVLDENVTLQEASRYVEQHRAALEAATGQPIAADVWRVGFRSALSDLLVNRLMFYVMIHRVRRQRFLPRVVRTWQRLNHLFAAEGEAQ